MKVFCEMVMSSHKDDILQLNQYMKSDKRSIIPYADLEFSI